MKFSRLILLLAFPLAVHAQKKEDLRFYTLKDSAFTRWTGLPNSLCDPDWETYVVDGLGDLYKLSMHYENVNRPMKLTPGGWVTWEKGLGPGSIRRLEMDGRGLLFAISREHIYLLQDSLWKELPTAANGYPPASYPDGGLYRLGDEQGGDNTYNADRKQIMRWSEGGYKPLGANGTPLFLKHKTDQFMIDRKGQVYSYEDHEYGAPKGPVEIYIYSGTEWKSIGTMPADITFCGFDLGNNLYVNGWDDDHQSYFKMWDGQSWADIQVPGNIDLSSGMLFDESLNIYIRGVDRAAQQSVLLRHQDSGWKEAARGDSGRWVSQFIPTSGDIYAIMDDGKTVQKYAGRWIVRQMEVANIPVSQSVRSNPDFTGSESDITRMKLFRQDGKLGIQDNKGYVWVYPVFDRISVEKAPAHVVGVQGDEELIRSKDFCVQLIAGTDTVFIPTTAFRYGTPDPDELKGFKRKLSRSCGKCHGEGVVPDREEQVKVRGEWVPGTTSYSTSGENTWSTGCNCYVYTTKVITVTTSGGHYKDTYETVTIPGGTCPACKGKGIFYSYEMYVYDANSGRYILQWQ